LKKASSLFASAESEEQEAWAAPGCRRERMEEQPEK
jgi:hypothetical protein